MNLTLESPVIQEMHKRCAGFIPFLRDAQIHPSYPLEAGLRPFRQGNVRVERELRRRVQGDAQKPSRIVHSYRQGGAGWTLAFGCAADVLNLVEEALDDMPPRPLELNSGVQEGRPSQPSTGDTVRAKL